jgi:hypothetical protein
MYAKVEFFDSRLLLINKGRRSDEKLLSGL